MLCFGYPEAELFIISIGSRFSRGKVAIVQVSFMRRQCEGILNIVSVAGSREGRLL